MIIENNLTQVVLLYQQKIIHLLNFSFSKEWSLNNDIQFYFSVQMILKFQKEINVIMYIIEFKKKKT